MNLEQKLLIDVVKASVTGKPAVMETAPDWKQFLKLASAHNLEALAFDVLQKSNIPIPEAVLQYLSNAYMQAIFMDTQMEYLRKELQAKLEQDGVRHIFLKGAVLKYNYPEPALRTMCDMDILVYAADFEKIDSIAKALGGKAMPGDGNHRNYAFSGGVAVEFHPNLLHHATPVGTDINPGWQYAKEAVSCAMELTEEGFYLNTLCHLANHFATGGVGVRFVLDVWVNRHLRKPQADRTFVEKELCRFGLLDFVNNIEDLAEYWFGDGPGTPLLEELGEYILTSGSHGTTNRSMLNALSLSPGGSRASMLWKKAFYPKAELEDRFPWCKGNPLLLPAAWCARAYHAITQHGNYIIHWSKETGKISKTEVIENQKKLRRFGIHQKSKS